MRKNTGKFAYATFLMAFRALSINKYSKIVLNCDYLRLFANSNAHYIYYALPNRKRCFDPKIKFIFECDL